ncbi:MAG: hypothetical protein JRD93_10085 [Deltaproteobacteria bacterium]|nr:hypothetical protein [Deltaproteobacteria bacterium]
MSGDRIITGQSKSGNREVVRVVTNYIIRVEGFNDVPQHLQQTVRDTMENAFRPVRGVVFDYTGTRTPYDVSITFSDEIPIWGAYGEQSRMRMNDELGAATVTVYVGLMEAMRLELPQDECELAFENIPESLGSMIAGSAVHELGHALGLEDGAEDDAGHVSDMDNYMWDSSLHPNRVRTRINNGIFEYTVVRGDTLSGIVHRWRRGRLHPCARGANRLTYQMVWETIENSRFGYIAHPTKSGIGGRIPNVPNWIYPGEKIMFGHKNFRSQEYRRYFPGWLGQKIFNDEQIRRMNDFVQQRIQTLSSSAQQ